MNKNIDYAPVILKKSYELNENFRLNLNNWFKGRGIPSWRDRLDILLSRLNFQKHKLEKKLEFFDPEKSEYENMKANGYFRIFDCGNMVFVKKYRKDPE